MAALTGTKVLFSDTFSKNGPLDGANWGINQAFWGNEGKLNPEFLGKTFIRQELPVATDGVAKLRLDTWNPVFKDGNSFYGSEAITKGAWDAKSTGGVAFEARMRFEGTQGGMIAGLFFYQQFTGTPDVQPRVPHNELDWEILTSQLSPNSVNKISTNVFPHEAKGDGEQDYPHSYPVTQIKGFSPNDWHRYRVEWLPNKVTFLIDGKVIRTETEHLPQADVKQQLHMNLWGVPDFWGPSPGDVPPISPQTGPNIGDKTLQPAKGPGDNKTFFFDVDSVKVEKLSTRLGSGLADRLVGSANHDGVDGGDGDDKLLGRGGHDTIWGGAGNDAISGDSGNDTIHGGSGDDRLLGKLGEDSIAGGAGDDRLEGGSDNDTLNGDAGRDVIVGEAGNDRLIGGLGADVLMGGGGYDRLTGGLDADILIGGEGLDRYIYTDIADSLVASGDVIRSWESGEMIDLSAVDANSRVFGVQAFSFIGFAAFTGAGELRVASMGGDTIVEGDINGDRTADFKITLAGNHNLNAGSFIL